MSGAGLGAAADRVHRSWVARRAARSSSSGVICVVIVMFPVAGTPATSVRGTAGSTS